MFYRDFCTFFANTHLLSVTIWKKYLLYAIKKIEDILRADVTEDANDQRYLTQLSCNFPLSDWKFRPVWRCISVYTTQQSIYEDS